MKKNILFLDIDGTLLDNTSREIPKSAILALKEIHNTTEIVIATGRAKYTLDAIEPIRDLIDYYVLINGQYIMSSTEVLYRNPMPKDVITEVVEKLNQKKLAFGFQGEDTEGINFHDSYTRRVFTDLSLERPHIHPTFYLEKDVYQMWVFGKEEDVMELSPHFPYLQFIKWLNVGFDILGKENSKGLGMKKLIELKGWQDKNIIAIGDGENDYEMLRDAPLGIAMGNASDRIKQISDAVTDTVSNDGLAKAIYKYIK